MKPHHGDKPNNAAPTNAHAEPRNAKSGSEETKHISKNDRTSTVPSKRKATTKDEPSKAPRRSARGTQQPSIDPVKMLQFLVSPASTDLCRPKDEIEDLKTRGSHIKTYSSSTFTPFEELICAVILSRPISHALGLRSIRTIFNDPWKFNTPKSLREAGPDGRRKALDEARTQHRQKTADELGLLVNVLEDKLGDNEDDVAMARVRRDCDYDAEKVGKPILVVVLDEVSLLNSPKELNIIKTSVKGMGKTGIDIFRRRIQGVWPECYPFIDQKTSASLEMFGLPTEAKDLESFIERHWKELQVEGIEAKYEKDEKRKAFVRLLEHAVGAHLEGNVDAIKAEAA
ncbi:hypothetical protein G7Y79_00017g043260 [Physcia stellaris]|nr:hypothetical protein G7Y79_00017g043260 [Physcia stellaris]